MSYNEQPAWQPPGQPAPKRHRRWPWYTLAAVIVVIVVAAVSTSGGNTGSTTGGGTTTAPLTSGDPASPAGQVAITTAPTPPAANDTVVYTITGGHAQDITYIAPGGNVQESQVTDRTALPWTQSFTVPAGTEGLTMELTAQNAGGGTIGCTITVNGKAVASNSSSGEYAVVSCSGSS